MTASTQTLAEQLAEFASSRPGWTMYEQRGDFYAGRRFEYPKGARALLSVRQVNPDRPAMNYFAAQINVPFSAGPEVSDEGRLDACTDWAIQQERVLKVPTLLPEVRTGAQALELVGPLKWGDLNLLCVAVFDLTAHGGAEVMRTRLIRHCCGPRADAWALDGGRQS